MKKYLRFIIPVIAVGLCVLFIFTPLDFKVADLFQRTLKSTPDNKNVLMVNVDDKSVEGIGAFPFSRDVYSDLNYNLKDLGAESVVYDLSFLDRSPAKVDESYVTKTLPSYISTEFDNINEAVGEVLSGINSGAISTDAVEEAYEYISGVTEEAYDSIDASVSYVVRDLDKGLGESLKFFDNSYLTLTFNNDAAEISDEEKEYLKTYVALKNVTEIKDKVTPRYREVEPAIFSLLKNARSAGCVNAPVDSDGYLRRLDLVYKYNGDYYGQLAFVPVLNHFGNPAIEISNSYILLKGCKLDDGTVKDIKIPRDEYGSVLVKYAREKFDDYNNLSLYDVYKFSDSVSMIEETAENLDEAGFFEYWEDDNPVELYKTSEYIKGELKNGEDADNGITMEQYLSYRNAFFDTLKAYYSGKGQELMLLVYGDDEETAQYIKENLSAAKEQFDTVMELREKLRDKVQNAICIVGTTATSTTDFGLTQYEDHYPNPGVHYTMANMLLSQDFVDDSPVWISILIAFILCFAYSFVTFKLKSTGKQIITGIVFLIVSTGLLLVFFMCTRRYIGVVIPFAALFITFIVSSVQGYLTSSHQKRFIQNAFSQCLSPDVVKEIVDNPSSFKLGGQTIDMTAIFTDIQKFSGFSELLSAGQLVALLNFYLTKMSDIIMENRGTVDKYEGDAIVAFVGAPIKTKDHAALACRAAISMKKSEADINDYIRKIAAAPKPAEMDDDTYQAFCIMIKNNKSIFTRIGLNSGSIVAGYMGSTNKKNYTMMGNNVNLASRLEGVNKQYHTGGILISAATREKLSDDFIVRSLDRVQVVNVVTPIRLYELLDVKDGGYDVSALVDYVDKWEQAMKVFEGGDYAGALEMFRKLSQIKPSDNVAKYYIELIEKFFLKGTYPTERDEFGVAYNPENPADMNKEWVGTSYEIKGTFKLLQK